MYWQVTKSFCPGKCTYSKTKCRKTELQGFYADLLSNLVGSYGLSFDTHCEEKWHLGFSEVGHFGILRPYSCWSDPYRDAEVDYKDLITQAWSNMHLSDCLFLSKKYPETPNSFSFKPKWITTQVSHNLVIYYVILSCSCRLFNNWSSESHESLHVLEYNLQRDWYTGNSWSDYGKFRFTGLLILDSLHPKPIYYLVLYKEANWLVDEPLIKVLITELHVFIQNRLSQNVYYLVTWPLTR